MAGVAAEPGGERGQDPLSPLHQHDLREFGWQLGIVAAEHEPQQLEQRAGELDSGGAGADHHERQPPAALDLIMSSCRVLQARQHVVSKPLGLRECLHAQRVGGQARVAEAVVLAAGSQHEVVERHLALATDLHDAAAEVDPGCLGVQEADVARSAERGPERVGDVGRGQQRARDLVEQRCELVVVAAVDQQHVDRL